MRSLQNKPNVQAPSVIYPEGRIKDDDGSGNGTPVNEYVYGDYHQFFARLLVEAGITPNEIAENAYDGFQSIAALYAVISKGVNPNNTAWNTSGIAYQSGYASGAATLKWKVVCGVAYLSGAFQNISATPKSGDQILTLPSQIFPSRNVYLPIPNYPFTTNAAGFGIQIDSSGRLFLFENGKLAGVNVDDQGIYNLDCVIYPTSR